MVLIRENKGAKIILHAKLTTFRAAKLKGFTVYDQSRGDNSVPMLLHHVPSPLSLPAVTLNFDLLIQKLSVCFHGHVHV